MLQTEFPLVCSGHSPPSTWRQNSAASMVISKYFATEIAAETHKVPATAANARFSDGDYFLETLTNVDFSGVCSRHFSFAFLDSRM